MAEMLERARDAGEISRLVIDYCDHRNSDCETRESILA
jgi:hypothetical protein